MGTLEDKVRAVWELSYKVGGQRWKQAVRDILGEINPVGDGDAKTASPSTYRPVGSTCPIDPSSELGTCPYWGAGCYAQGGNVNLHQRASSEDVDPSLASAIVGMIWALRSDRLCRLHVSGDFLLDGKVDRAYITGLARVADTINELAGREKGTALAWSYTHLAPKVAKGYVSYLASHGIIVRISDHAAAGGAVVHRFDTLQDLKSVNPEIKFMKCPAQLGNHDRTCAECRACWERPERTIVFDPHGPAHRKAERASLAVLN